MTGRSEIQLSFDMIDRAQRRLSYQKIAVKRLSFDRDNRCAELAKEMQVMMEEKLASLQKKHLSLVTDLRL